MRKGLRRMIREGSHGSGVSKNDQKIWIWNTPRTISSLTLCKSLLNTRSKNAWWLDCRLSWLLFPEQTMEVVEYQCFKEQEGAVFQLPPSSEGSVRSLVWRRSNDCQLLIHRNSSVSIVPYAYCEVRCNIVCTTQKKGSGVVISCSMRFTISRGYRRPLITEECRQMAVTFGLWLHAPRLMLRPVCTADLLVLSKPQASPWSY